MKLKEQNKLELYQIDSNLINLYYNSSIPRINGELAVTRAFGDINYRHAGLIAVPEI